jgi:hypothetical protein
MDEDPWDWTIDEVVNEFCKVRNTWTDSGRYTLPDPTKLEEVLRENDVDGIILLSEIGQNELKADFEIKSIGQRSKIIWSIQQLRQRSIKWRTHCHDSLNKKTALLSGGQTPYSSTGPIYSPQPSTIRDTSVPIQKPVEEAPITHNNVLVKPPVFAGTAIQTTQHNPEVNPFEGNVENYMVDGNDQSVPHKHVSLELSNVGLMKGLRRRAETLVRNDGPKKRRLILGDPIALVASSVAQPEPSDLHCLLLPSRSALSGVKPSKPAFLGSQRLTPNDIFFGTGKFSSQVNSDWDMKPVMIDESTPSDFELILHPDRSIPGRQKVVYRRLLHFFRSAGTAQEVNVNGFAAYVVSPYSSSDIAENSRSVILFTPTDTDIAVTREKASRFDEGVTIDPETVSNSSSNYAWDFLDHWRNEKTEELPTYGASEINSEWEECMKSLAAEEMAEAEKESRMNDRLLNQIQIEDVIEQEIEQYIKQWQTRKLPLRLKNAWTIWKKGKHSRQRLEFAMRSRKEAAKLTTRLEKLESSILNDEWSSEKKIRNICKTMEETVYQREEERFKASICLRTEPPPCRVTKLRTKKKIRSIHGSDEEGIALSSDSEVVDDVDDGFIDIDRDSVEQLDMTNRTTPQASEYHNIATFEHTSPRISEDVALFNLEHKSALENRNHTDTQILIELKSEIGFDAPRNSKEQIWLGTSANNFIDLTLDDDEDEEPEEPKGSLAQKDAIIRNRSPGFPSERSMVFGHDPFEDSDAKISSWDYQQLEENGDRKRLIMKLVLTMSTSNYLMLRRYVLGVTGNDIPGQVFSAADAILHEESSGKSEDVRREQLLRLYCCWLEGSADCFRHATQSGLWGFLQPHIPQVLLERVMYKTSENDARRFSDFLRQILTTHPTPILAQSSSSDRKQLGKMELSNSEEDSEREPSQNTPHKKRKRIVLESQTAKDKRDRAQNHRQVYEKRALLVLQTQSSGLTEITTDQYMVNIGKQADQDPIYLNPYIGERIQAHQLEGLQFMWREIVAASGSADDQSGCLLAHTMGLGKTMQAIALLVTIAEAASSAKKTIRRQIPRSLRKSRTLVILPAALAYNWVDEFEKWVPPGSSGLLGSIRTMRSEDKTPARLHTLESWYQSGGILIMSYDLVRLWVANNSTKISSARFSSGEHEKVLRWLLKGPNLVIADEAHFLKNIDSKIHAAVTCFKTKSRIALTGSPLNNNLKEYYAMISESPNDIGIFDT